MEGIAQNNSCTNRAGAAQVLEKKARPQEQLNCPRCNSTNTKFCYYNNYSLTQPRYFCKTCRRYWTEGGSLRNVPVGGGSRKNKKIISASSLSSSISSTSPKVSVPDLNPPINPKMQGGEGGHDLNLAFPAMENNNNSNNKYHHHGMMSQYIEMAKMEIGSDSHSVSAVEMLRSGMAAAAAPNYVHSLMPTSNALFPPAAGFPIMQEIKPNLGFSIDALDQNRSSSSPYGVHENNNGRLLFPFGEMKQLSAAAGHVEVEQNKDQGNSTGYWTGMIGEGSSW